MLDRLFQNWVYATPPIAVLLIGLYPFLGTKVSLPLFLSLPVYMIHQYEEHDNNRFTLFLNGMMGAGKKGLSSADVWIINIIFVWCFLLVVFHLASFAPGWGVLAAYLLAINGVLHVLWAIKFRKYNPGLWTSIFLFIPLAVWVFSTTAATALIHIVSATFVIGVHVAIMIAARRPA